MVPIPPRDGIKIFIMENNEQALLRAIITYFLILYPIQLITKPFVYWGVILYVTLLCITTPSVKNLKQNESDFCTIQSFCTSNMILSAYMYRKEYSGFLRKVGKLPRYLNEILHQFGANATVLMSYCVPIA